MHLSFQACAGLGPLREQAAVPHEEGAGRDNSVALGLAQLLGGQDGLQQALGLFIKKERGPGRPAVCRETMSQAWKEKGV